MSQDRYQERFIKMQVALERLKAVYTNMDSLYRQKLEDLSEYHNPNDQPPEVKGPMKIHGKY